MAATNKNSAAKVNKVENQAKAIELRKMGLSYTEIAQQIGCSLGSAHGYVKEAMEESRAQIEADAAELKALELIRLDSMLRGLWPDARKGHQGAVDRVLKIMERRSKMLGLDAPTRIGHGGDRDAPFISVQHNIQNLSDAELERIIATSSA